VTSKATDPSTTSEITDNGQTLQSSPDDAAIISEIQPQDTPADGDGDDNVDGQTVVTTVTNVDDMSGIETVAAASFQAVVTPIIDGTSRPATKPRKKRKKANPNTTVTVGTVGTSSPRVNRHFAVHP